MPIWPSRPASRSLSALLAPFGPVLGALRVHGLRTADDGDRRVLVDFGAVLGDEFGRHLKRRRLSLLDLADDRLPAAVDLDRDLLLDHGGLRGRAEVPER